MSMEKAIQHGKEKRHPYYGSKRFDASCRPHGTCGFCLGNRMHSDRKREPVEDEEWCGSGPS